MDDARRAPPDESHEPDGEPAVGPSPMRPSRASESGPVDVEAGLKRVKRRFPKILARLGE